MSKVLIDKSALRSLKVGSTYFLKTLKDCNNEFIEVTLEGFNEATNAFSAFYFDSAGPDLSYTLYYILLAPEYGETWNLYVEVT